MSKYIFITGNHPTISIAELKARYDNASFETIEDNFVIIKTEVKIDQKEFDRLGGVIKAAKIISSCKKEQLISTLSDVLSGHYQNKKLNYGLSIYGVSEKQLRPILLKLKKYLKKKEVKARFINHIFQNISAAQYKSLKNDGLELIVVKTGQRYLIGKIIGTQNIDAYSKRDYKKPFRDMQMGMMPPKLAQVLINLTGIKKGVIWDPFCGSGTLIMEGLLIGFNMMGSDINPRHINGAQKNINWLKKEFNVDYVANIFVQDATKPINKKIDAIAFEGDLGVPHNHFIKSDQLQDIINELNDLYVRFFKTLKDVKFKSSIVCALPFFRLKSGQEIDMKKTIETIEKMQFKQQITPLKYSRPNQSVGRAIYKFQL